MNARILVAEDEAPMRTRLLEQLAEVWPEATVVAAVEDGLDAWDAYLEHEPNVAFLDIRMPGMSGLEVASRIIGFARDSALAPAHIVFVTAYDQYAVEAFERGAIDYLLKPIDRERLRMCVKRLIEAEQPRAGLLNVLRNLQSAQAAPGRTKWIKASAGRKIRLINVSDVRYFQADAKYTRVVFNDGEALLRTPLKELIAGLDPEVFWQIHRGVVINVAAIAGAERADSDRLEVIVKETAERLPVSRAFAHLFKD